jgi:hypothetical protein
MEKVILSRIDPHGSGFRHVTEQFLRGAERTEFIERTQRVYRLSEMRGPLGALLQVGSHHRGFVITLW